MLIPGGHNANKASSTKIQKFIEKAHKVHSLKYDYSLINQTNYVNIRSKLPIICSVHGVFHQRGDDHNRGHGCPKCGKISCSTKALIWLDNIAIRENINIQHAGNGGEYRVPATSMSADGYCPDTNTIYEFDGDAFHGNPNRYSPNVLCHPYDKTKTAHQLYEETLIKHQRLKELGYNLITIWETDFDKLLFEPVNIYSNLVVSKIDSTYPDQLKNIGITLNEPYKGSTQKHHITYDACGHTGYVTPQSKIQMYRKYGHYNCNTCGKRVTDEKNKQRGNYVNRLNDLNYTVTGYVNAGVKCTLTCVICGKRKHVIPSAVIQRGKPCCNQEV